MTPHRTKLHSVLAELEQAETATTKLLTLDAGPPADDLAEVLGKTIENIRAIVQELLGE